MGCCDYVCVCMCMDMLCCIWISFGVDDDDMLMFHSFDARPCRVLQVLVAMENDLVSPQMAKSFRYTLVKTM